MIDMEGTHDNDDEKLTFISLAALTANIVRYLDKRAMAQDNQADEEQRRDNHRKEEEARLVKRD